MLSAAQGGMDITAPRFIDADKAREYLEAQRWPEGPYCPHCGSFAAKRLEGKAHRAGLIQCNDCREQYTVTVGTVFERSKVPLNKWLLCNHLLCASKKGMSAHEIHRLLGVTYKTAWFMCHRIREAMDGAASNGPLGGQNTVVEADEPMSGARPSIARSASPLPKRLFWRWSSATGRFAAFTSLTSRQRPCAGLSCRTWTALRT
jgi:transposase-like protein